MVEPETKPRASESGHWYDPKTCSPVYEVPYADPKKGMRPATLRDARKLGLVPGQSSICGVLAAPELIEWIKDQAIKAALETQVVLGEPHDEHLRRIRVAADNVRDTAAERGTAIHAAIEAHFSGRRDQVGEMAPWVDAVIAALPATPYTWKSEGCLVGPCFGTKIDLVSSAGEWLIDFKTKDDIDKDGSCRLYDKHLMQLAAGGSLMDPNPSRHGIMFVDRNKPAARLVEAGIADIAKGVEMFNLCTRLWQLKNSYVPA